jgi:hypothetical protein
MNDTAYKPPRLFRPARPLKGRNVQFVDIFFVFSDEVGYIIERSLIAMEPAVTCDEMAEKANKLGRDILAEYAEKEKAYDARTNFGETQGAVFP